MFLISGIALAAEIASAIGMIVFIFSTTIKKRKKFIVVQTIFFAIDSIVWILKRGYSALIQDIIAVIRNILVYFNKQTKILDIIFIVLAAVIGLLVIDYSNFKFYELFPIISTLETTIILLKTKNIKMIKLSLVISSALWAAYGLFAGVYVTFAFNVISCITSLVSLLIMIKTDRKLSDLNSIDLYDE